ncbi:hypothetical protein Tco_0003801 [Tanacetum coccineum]
MPLCRPGSRIPNPGNKVFSFRTTDGEVTHLKPKNNRIYYKSVESDVIGELHTVSNVNDGTESQNPLLCKAQKMSLQRQIGGESGYTYSNDSGGDNTQTHEAIRILSTLHFLKFPENSFDVLKLLENSVEVFKILENKLESMKIMENKLESLKLQENQLVDGLGKNVCDLLVIVFDVQRMSRDVIVVHEISKR